MDRLEAVPPQYIAAFLQSRGWRLEHRGEDGEQWVLIDSARERFGSVLVPYRTPDDPGWRQARLHVLLDELRLLEDVSAEDLLRLVGAAGRDTIRVRIIAPQTQSGEIPLDYATDLVTGVVVMMEAAARATYRPQRRYQTGRQPDVVRGFMRTAQLGQTEAGSFVVIVHAPLPPEQLAFDTSVASLPFEREAVITLEQALTAAYHLAQTDAPPEDELLDAVDVGLTQNLMRALARLRTDDFPASAEVGIAWSPAYGGRAPVQQVFDSARLSRLSRISGQLDAEPEQDGFELVGTVEGVRYLSTLDVAGRATIRANVRDRDRSVLVDVAEEADYQRLAEAHLQRRVVRLRGRLVPGGRRYVSLDDPEIVSA